MVLCLRGGGALSFNGIALIMKSELGEGGGASETLTYKVLLLHAAGGGVSVQMQGGGAHGVSYTGFVYKEEVGGVAWEGAGLGV